MSHPCGVRNCRTSSTARQNRQKPPLPCAGAFQPPTLVPRRTRKAGTSNPRRGSRDSAKQPRPCVRIRGAVFEGVKPLGSGGNLKAGRRVRAPWTSRRVHAVPERFQAGLGEGAVARDGRQVGRLPRWRSGLRGSRERWGNHFLNVSTSQQTDERRAWESIFTRVKTSAAPRSQQTDERRAWESTGQGAARPPRCSPACHGVPLRLAVVDASTRLLGALGTGSGSCRAAFTTALAFSIVLPERPVPMAARSRDCPAGLGGFTKAGGGATGLGSWVGSGCWKRSGSSDPSGNFPGGFGFPPRVLPSSLCLSAAASASFSFNASKMATASLGRKSLRRVFSCCSPRIISSRSTMETGTSVRARRRSRIPGRGRYPAQVPSVGVRASYGAPESLFGGIA